MHRRLRKFYGIRFAPLFFLAAASACHNRARYIPALPSPGKGTEATPSTPLIIGETFTINSQVLHETRRINVYMPAGYAESPDLRLPVLYMPDGGMAEDFLHVAGLVQVSVGNATMRPFILVGIENTERRRDMTGPTTNPEDKKIAPHVGGSEAFRTFIRTELFPAVESRYRTTSEKAIVGESLAGLFVVETLLREPDMFDTYMAFDPSLWWNNHQLLTDASDLLRTNLTHTKTFFFASSDEPELVRNSQQLQSILKSGTFPNLKWTYVPLPAEGHGTIYHPAALIAFRQLLKPPPAPSH